MAIDTDRIDEAVLALLQLTLHDEARAWKGHAWEVLDRLHRKGMIGTASTVRHGHYRRSLQDLPAQGASVTVKLAVRCRRDLCGNCLSGVSPAG